MALRVGLFAHAGGVLGVSFSAGLAGQAVFVENVFSAAGGAGGGTGLAGEGSAAIGGGREAAGVTAGEGLAGFAGFGFFEVVSFRTAEAVEAAFLTTIAAGAAGGAVNAGPGLFGSVEECDLGGSACWLAELNVGDTEIFVVEDEVSQAGGALDVGEGLENVENGTFRAAVGAFHAESFEVGVAGLFESDILSGWAGFNGDTGLFLDEEAGGAGEADLGGRR